MSNWLGSMIETIGLLAMFLAPVMVVRLVVGSPGSGKSNKALDLMLTDIELGRPCLLLDSKGSTARQAGLWTLRTGHEERLVYDPLDDCGGPVVQYAFGYRTMAGSRESLKQEAARIYELLNYLLFVRGQEDRLESHAYYELVRMAFRLVFRQTKEVAFSKVRYGLSLGSREHDDLMAGCWCGETTQWFERMATSTKVNQERVLHPGERLLDTVFGDETLRIRLDGNYAITTHLADGGIHMIEGSREIAPNSMRMLMGMVLSSAIDGCMKGRIPLQVYCEEFDDLGLSPGFVRTCEIAREYGITITVISQSACWE